MFRERDYLNSIILKFQKTYLVPIEEFLKTQVRVATNPTYRMIPVSTILSVSADLDWDSVAVRNDP